MYERYETPRLKKEEEKKMPDDCSERVHLTLPLRRNERSVDVRASIGARNDRYDDGGSHMVRARRHFLKFTTMPAFRAVAAIIGHAGKTGNKKNRSLLAGTVARCTRRAAVKEDNARAVPDNRARYENSWSCSRNGEMFDMGS